ncbi:MAG: hypothetical protein IJ600_00245 [Lachnospiraceae bacterium]|nr:hypothetical protein [Lachnospiraceae bacterium]
MTSEKTRECELAPLKLVPDNYEKVVLVMRTDSTASVDGIKIRRVFDFLLEDN